MATEKVSNIAQSTLNGAINNSVTSLVVASASTFPTSPQFRIKIDDEIILVTGVSGTTFTVTRGAESTTAASHSNGATVTGVLTAGGLNQLLADILLQAGSGASTIWAGGSDKNSSTYSGSDNGLRYTPLSHGSDNYFEFQWIPQYTGTASLSVMYSMSASSANNVKLRLDVLKLGNSANPTTSPTTGTSFTITPGANVLTHTLSSSDSSDLSIAVTAGNVVYCKLYRLGTDTVTDTHTGDMRILGVRVN